MVNFFVVYGVLMGNDDVFVLKDVIKWEEYVFVESFFGGLSISLVFVLECVFYILK